MAEPTVMIGAGLRGNMGPVDATHWGLGLEGELRVSPLKEFIAWLPWWMGWYAKLSLQYLGSGSRPEGPEKVPIGEFFAEQPVWYRRSHHQGPYLVQPEVGLAFGSFGTHGFRGVCGYAPEFNFGPSDGEWSGSALVAHKLMLGASYTFDVTLDLFQGVGLSAGVELPFYVSGLGLTFLEGGSTSGGREEWARPVAAWLTVSLVWDVVENYPDVGGWSNTSR